MKLGRNFTNTLILDFLKPDEQKKIISGELDLFSLNALGLLECKREVVYQIETAKRLGLDWLELDCDVPNPYLDFDDAECSKIRKKAEKLGIELSAHLSYSSIGKEVACIQDYERELVTGLHTRYMDFASKIGAKAVVLHPGTAPFYFLSPLFLEKLETALLKTLEKLVPLAEKNGIKFHVENNVSFDNIYWEVDDILRLLEKANRKIGKVYFNLDIGHWFTRAEKGKEIPADPLEPLNSIPPEMVYELHLNDYVPKKIIFHPPLVETPGLLSKDVLERYFRIMKEKLKPEVIILETAFKTREQVARRKELLEQETSYIRDLMK